MSITRKRKLIELYNRDLDELFSALSDYEKTVNLYEAEKKISVGKGLFAKLRKKIYSKVCIECKIQEQIDESNISDITNVTSTLIDIITPIIPGFPVAVVATIIIKIGIRKFCSADLEES